ncbi:hypothetical protein [Rhodonellum sp.]|uniref:hypothetical protein n=1 Tax=Rhodonellum sp. TaxID=2231180 RepID=UPI0027213239|nr:hypothetical protein [Rhodonellum sp.]MDO9551398.1 hypothetical protein [Rhodonellum sp.]
MNTDDRFCSLILKNIEQNKTEKQKKTEANLMKIGPIKAADPLGRRSIDNFAGQNLIYSAKILRNRLRNILFSLLDSTTYFR